MKLLAYFVAWMGLVGTNNETVAHFTNVAGELSAARAAAIKAGVPMHSRELAPPPVKSEDNAAPLLKEADARLRELKPKDARGSAIDPSSLIRKSDEESRLSAASALNTVRPALDLVIQATKRPSIDFGRKWDTDDPELMYFPEYAQLREFAKLLTARAQLRVREGDSLGAIEDLRASFKLAIYAGTDPFLIGGLVQIAIDAIATRQVEWMLSERPSDVGLVASLGELLKEQPKSSDLWQMLRGEAAMGISFAERWSTSSEEMKQFLGDEETPIVLPTGISNELAGKAFLVRALQTWTDVAQAIRANDFKISQSEVIAKMSDRLEKSTDPTYRLQQVIMPVFAESGWAIVTRHARLEVTEALLAAISFKQSSGSFPATLAETGFQGLDPFTQKPLKMKVIGDEIWIWSVGKDLKDDGASEDQNKDIVAKFPRR